MGRISTTTRSNDPSYDVSATVWNNLIGDYCSLSDTSAQTFTGTFRPTFPAFTVFKSGSDAYAVNSAGNIVYGGSTDEGSVDGADHDAVIQACIDALTSGGLIYVKNGSYTISATMVDNSNSNITVEGESRDGVIFELSTNIACFTLTSTSGWTLKNFSIDGNDHTDSWQALMLTGVDNSLMENLYIHNVAKTGANDAYGVHMVGCSNTHVVRCRFIDIDKSAVTIANASQHCNIVECYSEDCTADTNASAHYVIYGSAANNCIDCNIINCTGIDSGNYVAQIYQYCDYCYIRGGYFEDGATGEVTLGRLGVENTCTHIGISGATVRGVTGTPSAVAVSSYNKGSVIEGCTIYAVGIGVWLPVGEATVNGNHIYVYDSDKGVLIESAWNAVTGNQIRGTVGTEGLYGVQVQNNAAYIHNLIGHNVIYGMQYGVVFEANSDFNFARGNSIYADDTAYTNNGGANNAETDADDLTY